MSPKAIEQIPSVRFAIDKEELAITMRCAAVPACDADEMILAATECLSRLTNNWLKTIRDVLLAASTEIERRFCYG